MEISVIIPTHNRKSTLQRCLAAVTKQDYPDFEVIVVDDASTDDTGEMIRQYFPQVRYFYQKTKGGPAITRNRGIQEATGELIIFTDDDCVPPDNWLRRHLEYYNDQSVGAVGGPQIPRTPSFYDKVEIAHYANEYLNLRRIEKITGWEGLATSNMSVRRRLFDEVGLFDEEFLTGADPEFARRVSQAGYVLIQDPDLKVEHLKIHSLRSYLKMQFRRGCGSVLADIKGGTLSPRRFIPLINVANVRRDWLNFCQIFGKDLCTTIHFWGLSVITRLVSVTGRIYYYWTIGRFYRTKER